MEIIVNVRYKLSDIDKKDIKRQVKENKTTLTKIAHRVGISKGYFSDVLSGARLLTPELKEKIEECGIKFITNITVV